MVALRLSLKCQKVTGCGQQFGESLLASHIKHSCFMMLTSHIRMMPENSVYGDWPRSGEIDIVESRGNDAEKYALGNNIISSTLHWGTSYSNDMYKLTTAEWGAVRTKYSNGLHTFGMEWSEKYMLFWVDKKLRVSSIPIHAHKSSDFYSRFASKSSIWTFLLQISTRTVNWHKPPSMEVLPITHGLLMVSLLRTHPSTRVSTSFSMLQSEERMVGSRKFTRHP